MNKLGQIERKPSLGYEKGRRKFTLGKYESPIIFISL